MTNQNGDHHQSNCRPTFFLQATEFSSELCLTTYRGKDGKDIFQWRNCTETKTFPLVKLWRWVKFKSRKNPEVIQICYDDSRKKCLISQNPTGREATNTVLLANYQSFAEASPSQLWKFNNKTGEIGNIESSWCLVTTLPRKISGSSSRIQLFSTLNTTRCEAKCEDSYTCEGILMKKWQFTPTMNKDKFRECADFPILSKIPVGNYYKILLRVVFTLNRVVIF